MSSFDSVDWSQVLKKEARGIANADLGEVQEIHQEMSLIKLA